MDNVRLHAGLRPNKIVVKDLATANTWTYQEYDELIARCVAYLVANGVEEGSRVACIAVSSGEQLALQLACARIGAIFVPLNWRLSKAELLDLLADCSPTLLLGDDLAEKMAFDCVDIRQLVSLLKGVTPMRLPQPSAELPSLMLYTSGTTGRPKGVLLSERNIQETAINFGQLGEVEVNSVSLNESPMFHIIGMITAVRPALMRGAQICISDRFIPERTLQRMADPALAISHYFCVPQMAVALRNVENFDPAKLANLKAIFTGGAPHPKPQIMDWVNVGLSIVDGFGMSEGGTMMGMPLDRTLIEAKAGSVGLPTPRMQARLVDDNGHLVADGVPGNLEVRGDNITQGYWQREADTKNAFTDDGWFRTGDIMTRDSDGFYYVTGRKKDMFISGGENVYPAEIESLLIKYPGVKDLSVVGLPDEKWGEVGCVFYVSEHDLTVEDFANHLADKLARFKIPQRVHRVDELPRNASGKVLKHVLAALT